MKIINKDISFETRQARNAQRLEFWQKNSSKIEEFKAKNKFSINKPLSQKLNDFINGWFEDHKDSFIFSDVDDFDCNDIDGTLKKHIETYKKTGKISIWTGCSDTSIFADSKINHKFRAWHDFHHITKNLSFDEIGEREVCEHQKNDLPKSYIFERVLLDIEINGQVEYFKEKSGFVVDQIEFCKAYLKGGIKEALKID